MAAYLDIPIEQGATFTVDLAVTDVVGAVVDLTGYTARMTIKRDAREAAALLSLTTANNRIIITAALGRVALALSALETAAITTWTRGVYDLELISPASDVTRLCEGAVVVTANVTT